MLTAVLALMAGIASMVFWQRIPNLAVLISIIFSLSAIAFLPKSKILEKILFACMMFFLGVTLSAWQAKQRLDWQLPEDLQSKTILVQGSIASIPAHRGNDISFELHLEKLQEQFNHQLIRLSWYGQHPDLKYGQVWRLAVRVKRPWSNLNPGGVDWQLRDFVEGVRATGYVLNFPKPELLKNFQASYFLGRLRQNIASRIFDLIGKKPEASLITALTVGDRARMTENQWQILRATGTSHLMAISGLHIGLVAGLAFSLVQLLWKLIPSLALKMANRRAGALASLIAALVYASLAGFALPTQRAVIMISVIALITFSKRNLAPFQSILLACAIVLLLEPFSIFTASFWLSFSAVTLIIYGMSGHIVKRGFYWQHGRMQWVISIGFIPISLIFFQSASLISFLANLIAIPVVGFIVVPLSLLALPFLFLWSFIAKLILNSADFILHWVWWVLTKFSQIPHVLWLHTMPNKAIVLTSLIGIFLLMTPRGFKLKIFCIFYFLPLFFYQTPRPKFAEVWMTMLDVGQGLSVVLQTQKHVLIYDTGPSWRGFSSGESIILPYLQAKTISKINTLMISHADNDHSGGANFLLKHFQIQQVLASDPRQFEKFHARSCHAGQSWVWDGVRFTVLWPDLAHDLNKNNASCVLKVSTGGASILLPGDIEKPAEQALAARDPHALQANILIAAHHGSKTSSSAAFRESVDPQWVLFATGNQNRYRFPHQAVVSAWQIQGTNVLNSAKYGAISFYLSPTSAIRVALYRLQHWRIWFD